MRIPHAPDDDHAEDQGASDNPGCCALHPTKQEIEQAREQCCADPAEEHLLHWPDPTNGAAGDDAQAIEHARVSASSGMVGKSVIIIDLAFPMTTFPNVPC
jgi:hypothetical protein